MSLSNVLSTFVCFWGFKKVRHVIHNLLGLLSTQQWVSKVHPCYLSSQFIHFDNCLISSSIWIAIVPPPHYKQAATKHCFCWTVLLLNMCKSFSALVFFQFIFLHLCFSDWSHGHGLWIQCDFPGIYVLPLSEVWQSPFHLCSFASLLFKYHCFGFQVVLLVKHLLSHTI